MELGKKDGKLRVHYNDRLVSLLREVRQLAALGFNIPGKIQSVAKTAQKFYRQGVILKQVCETCVEEQVFSMMVFTNTEDKICSNKTIKQSTKWTYIYSQ